jgi:hypothetical protein
MHIDMAKRAGIPGMEAHEEALKTQAAAIARVKNVYFPNG